MIYLFQKSLRLFLLITRAGQQGIYVFPLENSPMQKITLCVGEKYSTLLVISCSELLDPSFLFALDNGEKYSVQPMRFSALLKMTRVKVKLIVVAGFILFSLNVCWDIL